MKLEMAESLLERRGFDGKHMAMTFAEQSTLIALEKDSHKEERNL